jgi:hypothetical protein
MRSCEALQAAINGKTVEFAKELHLATPTLHKWQEPTGDFTDSGAYNPLDRIETIVRKALELKSPGALNPIYYLCEQLGLLAIPMPTITASDVITDDLVKSIERFGALAQTASKAIADQKIEPHEARDIRADGMSAIRAILTIVKDAEQAAGLK